MAEQRFSDLPFSELPLADELMEGIRSAGFEMCTPIQAGTLPMALEGKDIAGKARTGTGKTAAFLLATMQRLIGTERKEFTEGQPAQPRALMLAPTRELAVQIYNDAVVLGEAVELEIGLVFGGTGYEQQKALFTKPLDILIGTPGRLIDFQKQRLYTLDSIEVLVLDEADRMFDLGFIKDIRYILRRCPPPQKRLNMLFSATLGYRVLELAYEHMNDPQLVNMSPDQVTVEAVTQTLYHTANDEKISLLLGLFGTLKPDRSIVFVNTKRAAERVAGFFKGNGIESALLSGDVPQKKRLRLLEAFQKGELSVLVATDVAARGLHIDDVTHVFNYDLPQDAEDYVHRIGRTARAGASGVAVSFACEQYVFSLPEIETYIGQTLPVEAITDDLLVKPQPPIIEERHRPPPSRRRPRPRRRA
ncbi:MAG: DEAD/DEAH box helicase [Gammaproteobacteria bacterium]|nr:DEAD/DEAH box helicase [Gammaproteobacteria bacterium]